MIHYNILLLIMMVHFLADFPLQSHYWAINKFKNWKSLLWHVLTYSICIGILGTVLFTHLKDMAWFFIINFFLHLLTDAISSRLAKPLLDKGDHHSACVVLGADQFIHISSLVGTYLLLNQ